MKTNLLPTVALWAVLFGLLGSTGAGAQMTPPNPGASGLAGGAGAQATPTNPGASAPAGGTGAQVTPPSPRAFEIAAYVYAATNVCGFRIVPERFERLIADQGASTTDVGAQGPFGNRIRTLFVLISSRMAQDRPAACEAAWREFGAQGSVAPGVVEQAPG